MKGADGENGWEWLRKIGEREELVHTAVSQVADSHRAFACAALVIEKSFGPAPGAEIYVAFAH